MTSSTVPKPPSSSRPDPSAPTARVRRAIVGATFGLAALVCVFGSQLVREFEARAATGLVGWTFASDSVYTTVSDEPSIGFEVGQDWLSLPVTADLTGTYVLAAALILAAAVTICTRVPLTRVLIAFGVSALTMIVVVQARLVIVAAIWGLAGTNEYYDSRPWLDAATVVVAIMATALAYFILAGPRVPPGAPSHSSSTHAR